VKLDGAPARVLAEDGDAIGRAAEVMYVILHPLERHHLILQAGVAGRVLVAGV